MSSSNQQHDGLRDAPTECPPLVELASYIDSNQGDSVIRAHVEQCACCTALITGGLGDSQPDLTFVPASVLEAAMALVPENHSDKRKRLISAFAQRFAASAAALLVCAGGYQLGSALESGPRESDSIASEVSFALFDGAEDDDDLFAVADLADSWEVQQ